MHSELNIQKDLFSGEDKNLKPIKINNSIFNITRYKEGQKQSNYKTSISKILFLYEGQIKVFFNDLNESILLEEDKMLFLPEDTNIRIEGIQSSLSVVMKIENYDILYRQANLTRITLEDLESKKNSLTSLPIKTILKSLSNILIELTEQEIIHINYQELMRRMIFTLIDIIYSKEEVINFFYPIINKGLLFRNYILNSYTKTSTVNDFIQASGLSRTTFYKTFKEEFGISAKQWLIKQKMDYILDRFKDRSIPLKEIMLDAGFETHSQFTRFCKTNFNHTPSELISAYRTSNKNFGN